MQKQDQSFIFFFSISKTLNNLKKKKFICVILCTCTLLASVKNKGNKEPQVRQTQQRWEIWGKTIQEKDDTDGVAGLDEADRHSVI